MRSNAPHLGLVCQTTTQAIRYRTITRTRLLALPVLAQESRLRELYLANLERLSRAVDFCVDHGIRLYRMPSSLFPFADTGQGREILRALGSRLGALGDRATREGIRLVLHPDQFVVLNSASPDVIRNSIVMLEAQAVLMDLLRQPRSPWAAIEIHGGKGGRPDELVRTVDRLPEAIRARLALENDERGYGTDDILALCRRTGLPMVFDAHHHVVHQGLRDYRHPSIAKAVRDASATWPDPGWQLVHISNGREAFGDPRHADWIEQMPPAYATVPWIEVEAKFKEQAIDRLRARWAPAAGQPRIPLEAGAGETAA